MLAYAARRLVVAVVYGGLACVERRCGRRRVGFSRFCRYHTDLILYDSFDECRERVDTGRKPWGG